MSVQEQDNLRAVLDRAAVHWRQTRFRKPGLLASGVRAVTGAVLRARLLEERDTVLILFPEGTRSGDSEPGEFKAGVGLLAAGRDIPVVPCHLAGTHAALRKGAWVPRPARVRLTIGAPRVYAHLPAS